MSWNIRWGRLYASKVFGVVMPSFDGGHSAVQSYDSRAGKALAGAGLFTGRPVHAITGAKVLFGKDTTDFSLLGILPSVWTRTYVHLCIV
jgi:hypothetical protein